MMEIQMVERVARAIDAELRKAHRYTDNGNGSVLVEGDVVPAEIARAVIRAMREPTVDMFMAPYDGVTLAKASTIWRRMIDAALTPDTSSHPQSRE